MLDRVPHADFLELKGFEGSGAEYFIVAPCAAFTGTGVPETPI